ncbi:MAG: hypothetical protein ACR2KD_08315 [Thermoleophilaceae bacterium]|jgi:PHD/YefM family antitoxin component YafN of YafNO toxin-antitoxin module|nr:hypothetical protein [Thermoleophilaceae bacterium]MBA3839738.1 hypothetical protein [Thermoleophilaceae bacterium]
MELLEVPAHEIRLPSRASEALDAGRPVAVTRYGRPVHVVLGHDRFALLAPLLELIEEGAAISPESLMTREDMALARDLAADTEPDEEEEREIASLLDDDAAT